MSRSTAPDAAAPLAPLNETKQRVWLQKAWVQRGAGFGARVVRREAPAGRITLPDAAARDLDRLEASLRAGRPA